MDIVIEGIITKEEGMNEVIDTIIHLKSVSNALLRVSCKEEGLQGRIGFGPGGHILGGRIEETGEVGSILKTVAHFYTREVTTAVDSLVSLIEPAMIVALGAGVGVLLASVLVPIYSIAQAQ